MTKDKTIRAEQRVITGQIAWNFRNLRISRGLSQMQLGEAMGVSFQQIQKYENGGNRLSAAALCQLAEILDVPVLSFFEGVADGKPVPKGLSRSTLEMVKHFNGLKGVREKQALITLAKCLAALEKP